MPRDDTFAAGLGERGREQPAGGQDQAGGGRALDQRAAGHFKFLCHAVLLLFGFMWRWSGLGYGSIFSLASKASRRPSPKKLKLITVEA